MPDERGSLRIIGERGGTISEITEFLSDLEKAYVAIYTFDQSWLPKRLSRLLPPEIWIELGYPLWATSDARQAPMPADAVPPYARLVLEHVRIESPGFWEVVASFNPLQQIREYLNDRHRRRQDREFREAAERERLMLENELIRKQIAEKDNAILRDRIAVLRDLGYSDKEIDRLIWSSIGGPMARLGRHQDTGLIGGAE
ncbi:hypothetical protein [Rhodanobacter aciditrophus]|uniref:hypothetical protein n=1 Tax=Rhodanobacter aciditrophus TaxID=1623218 RepID=UPI003CE6C471